MRRTSDIPPAGGWLYVIALGSNMRHHRHGPPEAVLGAGVAAMAAQGITIERVASVIRSAPVGPSWRCYANGAALVRSAMAPNALLRVLKRIEADLGRRRGRRWGSRVIDLDIVLWQGGIWASPGLSVPHVAYGARAFVLGPVAAIVPLWRDPRTGISIRQQFARLTRRQCATR
ncbi:MAG TPA: 2-amino-4-hydroxy-6-hydroxymethyldihydropteridine diphosphokinase [Novosphingobium sp.]|nr:2-amino-4-hydroxy-6-hydroxymethyldihydropteridine diphosphokinase [Novosphingobium sp.]